MQKFESRYRRVEVEREELEKEEPKKKVYCSNWQLVVKFPPFPVDRLGTLYYSTPVVEAVEEEALLLASRCFS